MQGGRIWGLALQLYALRSARNWGIGDFGDLQYAVAGAAELGAQAVGINPLHALFRHNPEHASPYSPASRLALNVLYIDVEAVPEFAQCYPTGLDASAHAQREAARADVQVDYRAVADLKWPMFERLYAQFRVEHLATNSARARAFQFFVLEQGNGLMRVALYQALQEHLQRLDANAWGWPVWPQEYRDPEAPAVQAFLVTQRERVDFYLYIQWLADSQLGACAQRARADGMAIGLYRDLAVGVDRAGADAWAYQKFYAHTASIGCPPDDFSLEGQNWGLPPMIPDALREAAYEPFIAMLRANMRHAGALRIDHVMGLMRLFWVPAGESAAAGGYVNYPLEDLLGILALESQRQSCLVIGEDLGTVPDEIRVAMQRLGVLSYRLLYFQQDASGEFIAPMDYPEQALVAVSTHDLATLAGFWHEADIDERARLGLFPSSEIEHAQRAQRARERERLIAALVRAQLWPTDSAPPLHMTSALAQAVHVLLALTPAKMLLVQAEDLLGQQVAVNLPGTDRERANWRIKWGRGLEAFFNDAQVRHVADLINALRPTRTASRPEPRII